ncbi:unnamed protein product [Rotaria sordida]|uniref:Uncharacterized protein n=1 Tax=Rotaria sordida TaxID=392033 RepID=A0A819NED6_9BILA|nr:unnamed protein product [Rotaria sordida]CAF4286991.1 unnamed protein product [Rotaria sordida]
MIGVLTNSNSVRIPIVQTGCCKAEFDSTYPVHLNGIISKDEFRKSINKINHPDSSNKNLKILIVASILSMIIEFVCCVVAPAANTNTQLVALLVAGNILMAIGSIILGCSCCIIHSRRAARLRQAIADESIKYSSRSPTPCSWRLDTSTTRFGGYGNHRNRQVVYHVCIYHL